MTNIQTLADELFGSSNATPVSARSPNWQQDLLATVDPERQRKQNIARALAAFGTTLSGTKGNFLQGLSAGLGSGANTLIDANQQAEEQRIKALQLLEQHQQQQQDRKRQMTRENFDVARTMNQDAIAADDRTYNRGRQSKLDARTQAREDRLANDADRRLQIAQQRADTDAKRLTNSRGGKNAGGPLTPWQQSQTRRDIENLTQNFAKTLPTAFDEQTTESNAQAVTEYRNRLYDAQGFDPNSGEYLGGTAPEQGAAPAAPAEGAPEMTKVLNGKTYVKINGQWYEQ